MSAHAGPASHTNRLSREKSPYLLQHAGNPVDWYPWGPEAFEKAARENKPVFLSIGYSTCHWCHVMEEESFENPATAEILNRDFVSIKVDREERPDIDSLYMNYVMATTGSGGWPMSVFLTPSKKPFYGGTYFPPEDRYGMPGFKSLLAELSGAWKTRREEIDRSADSAAEFLGAKRRLDAPAGKPGPELIARAAESLSKMFDEANGGFGRAPKFPRSHALSLLLRHWKRTGDSRSLAVVEKTLAAMAAGGLYDQLGGGFHRYSTDAVWRVPHFEKMLYDQALLALTYLEAWQATGNDDDARVARETLDYVLREMTSPEGAFYSAQDADSPDPFAPGKKREGAYFVWKRPELIAALDGRQAEAAIFRFGIEEDGNAVQDPHGEFVDQNVLYLAHTVEETARRFGMTPAEAGRVLDDAKKKLLARRAKRAAPHLDDKVLADWNGLMIAAFAEASRVLGEPRYRDAAVKAAEFVSSKLAAPGGGLFHRWRDGEAAVPGNLNDYAFMAWGYLAVYETTFDEKWLVRSRQAADTIAESFADSGAGGFYLTSSGAEELIARPKEIYDGAVPSGNSVAALVFRKLERVTSEPAYARLADRIVEAFAAELEAEPTGYTQLLAAIDWAAGPSSEVVF
ncbi:MAG TPA: thioredoxin domain-containing protein, partial [Candidatus Eisenbacteria bacterium]|nr:thioredoxin domain-containing protein [Candidatus Eisenbacteria bacterium]